MQDSCRHHKKGVSYCSTPIPRLVPYDAFLLPGVWGPLPVPPHLTQPQLSVLRIFPICSEGNHPPKKGRCKERLLSASFRTGVLVCWYGQRRHYMQQATQNTKGKPGKKQEDRNTVQVEIKSS